MTSILKVLMKGERGGQGIYIHLSWRLLGDVAMTHIALATELRATSLF